MTTQLNSSPFWYYAVEHEGQTPPSDTRSLIYYGSIWFEENLKGYAKKFNYGLQQTFWLAKNYFVCMSLFIVLLITFLWSPLISLLVSLVIFRFISRSSLTPQFLNFKHFNSHFHQKLVFSLLIWMLQQLKISFLCCGGACVGVLMAACMIITQYSQDMSLYNSCVCGLVCYFLGAQAVHFLPMSQILAFLTESPCKVNTDASVFVVFIIC